MNLDDFRAQLEQLAGPEPSPTTAAREAVGRKVRRTRRRTGAITAAAAVLVVAIVVAGINAAQDSPVRVRTLNTTTPTTPTTAAQCTMLPPIVPQAEVPSDVAAWASDAPVVGSGALWTVRSLLSSGMAHDSGVYRMKIGWLTRPFGIPTFAAHRLDGPGTFHGDGNQALNEKGEWVVSSLEFSAAGCWAVTVSYQDSTISYDVLIGDAPPPSAVATGTVTGTLRVEGGPAPGINHGVVGTVHVDGLSGSWAGTTTSDGTFTATVNAGTYKLTGSADGGAMNCGGGSAVVTAGRTTRADVICNIS
jgi:hypothetical protein